MRYFLCVKTFPGHRLTANEIAAVRHAARARLENAELYGSNDGGPSGIDVEILEDELASGSFSVPDFEVFCKASGLTARDEEASLHPVAAQAYLEHRWGQELFTIELPTEEAVACEIYAAVAAFARDEQFRLWSPMPSGGDLDPWKPGRLPPEWHRFSSI